MKPNGRWESTKTQLELTTLSFRSENPLENYGVHLTPFPYGNFQRSDPFPLWISESFCGGGMDIFWNYIIEF